MRALAIALVVAAAAPLAAQDKRTLRREDDVVVISGKEAPRLLKEKKERLRLFAWRDGKLVAAPLQVDERTPEGRWCFERGPNLCSDVDDGAVDDNDELVFCAGDAGDRMPEGKLPRGCASSHEVELVDPRDGGRAWIYLARFAGEPPPAPTERHVRFDVERAGVGRWRGRGFEAAIGVRSSGDAFLGSARLSFSQGDSLVPFADLAALSLRASVRGLSIERGPDEVRVSPGSWLAGPVRALVETNVEAYLVWGRWTETNPLGTTRSLATITRSGLSASITVSLPVDLDPAASSELALALPLAAATPDERVLSDADLEPATAEREGPGRPLRPDSWVALSGSRGAVVARLGLRGLAGRAGNRVEIEQGKAARLIIDLSGLTRGEYSADYLVRVLPGGPLDRAAAERTLDEAARPLQRHVR